MPYRGDDRELQKLAREVYDASSKKSKFLKSIEYHSSVVGFSNLSPDYNKGFQQAWERHSQQDIWSVDVYTSLGSVTYMVSNPADLKSFLKSQLHEIFNPTKIQSPKVLAKMMAVRLVRAYTQHIHALELQEKHHEHQTQLLEKTKELKQYLETLPTGIDVTLDMNFIWNRRKPHGAPEMCIYTADQLQEAIKLNTSHIGNLERFFQEDTPDTQIDLKTATKKDLLVWANKLNETPYPSKEYTDFRNFISRSDITNEMCRMACDLVLMREVIEG